MLVFFIFCIIDWCLYWVSTFFVFVDCFMILLLQHFYCCCCTHVDVFQKVELCEFLVTVRSDDSTISTWWEGTHDLFVIIKQSNIFWPTQKFMLMMVWDWELCWFLVPCGSEGSIMPTMLIHFAKRTIIDGSIFKIFWNSTYYSNQSYGVFLRRLWDSLKMVKNVLNLIFSKILI